MKMSKRVLAGFCSVVMVVGSLSGCGEKNASQGTSTSGPGSSKESSEAREVVRLVIAGIGEKSTVDPISGITSLGKADFEKYIEERVDGVEIEITGIPWDGWIQKMESIITAGEADIGFYTNQVMAPDWFVDHTSFMEADPEVNFETINSIYVEPAVHQIKYKAFQYPEATNQVFGLPLTMANNVFVYDTQLFEDWGVEPLSQYPTYEEIISKAEQMTGINPKTGQQNYGVFLKSYWLEWNAIGFDAVKKLESEDMILGSVDKTQYVDYIKDSEEVLNFFEAVERMVNIAPPGIATGTGREKFYTEENDIAIDMVPGGEIYRYVYADATEITDRFKPVFIPVGDNGEQGFPECFRVAVTKTANNPQLAWEVVKALSTDKEINNFYLTNYAFDKLPALKDVEGMPIMEYQINRDRHDYQMNTMFVTDDYWMWRTPLQKVLDQMVSKQLDPQQAREAFYTGVDEWVENTKKQLNQE